MLWSRQIYYLRIRCYQERAWKWQGLVHLSHGKSCAERFLMSQVLAMCCTTAFSVRVWCSGSSCSLVKDWKQRGELKDKVVENIKVLQYLDLISFFLLYVLCFLHCFCQITSLSRRELISSATNQYNTRIFSEKLGITLILGSRYSQCM